MDDERVPSIQEMFDMAWRGLKAQGFTVSIFCDEDNVVRCMYLSLDGRRCAWGHVDQSLTDERCNVLSLARQGVGLAAKLDKESLRFAGRLQMAHDTSAKADGESDPEVMESNLRSLAEEFRLTIPE